MSFGLLATVTAQIPNGGFEQWVDQGGYTEPAGWLTYNDVMTPQGYFATCDPGMPGAVGAYHAVITSRTVPGTSTIPIQGWMSTGFPYTDRPATLTGQWQYGIQPSDTGEVLVALVGWNGSSGGPEVIAHGILEVTGNVGAWTTFSVPFTYFSTATPDTALIQFAASKEFTAPVAGSYMKVDDLAFAGSVGMGEMAATPLFSLHPSPTTDVLHIVGGERITEVIVVDMSGRAVMRHGAQAERITLNVQELPAGRYFVHGRTMDGTRGMRSFVKQ
ncbi:MAG: T9SS type A sorting domain-containing protein [Flavobacteriales bacterium]|jgi:hypothetical protein|nr:T9SS type A sorting domain-containing protein [Flavobacteriales bacterium]